VSFGPRQQHYVAIWREATAIECGVTCLRETAGNEKGGRLLSVMASEVVAVRREGWR
jgi:hypothetical protein